MDDPSACPYLDTDGLSDELRTSYRSLPKLVLDGWSVSSINRAIKYPECLKRGVHHKFRLKTRDGVFYRKSCFCWCLNAFGQALTHIACWSCQSDKELIDFLLLFPMLFPKKNEKLSWRKNNFKPTSEERGNFYLSKQWIPTFHVCLLVFLKIIPGCPSSFVW